jgi:hypothetical protein
VDRMMPALGHTLLQPEQRTVLAALVANHRYELIPLEPVQEQTTALPSGACVTITALPRLGIGPTLQLAEWLAARGYNAVPHLSARLIRDRAHFADLLARIRDAGVRRIFVVGGTVPPRVSSTMGWYCSARSTSWGIPSMRSAYLPILKGIPTFPTTCFCAR